MGNEISTPAKINPVKSLGLQENLFIAVFRGNFKIWSLPNEIWFEILSFVKFHESSNLFLVNRDLLPICQEFFHSGNIGTNKSRNVRELKMQLKEGIFTIFVKRGGKFEPVPLPEVEPPKIFKSFECIRVGNCTQIQAMQFMIKFQVLFSKNNNMIIWKRNLLQPTTAINNAGNGISQLFRWQNLKQQNPIVDDRQFFFDWLEKEKILLELQDNNSSSGICRVLAEPIVAKFNGFFMINLKNEGNLCEEDLKLIYKWISSGSGHLEGNRLLGIDHFDANKALELACQIAMLFGKDHCDKVKAEKMELFILMPKGMQIPNRLQPICNIRGDQLATLRTISITHKGEHEKSAYLFYTKPLKHLFENKDTWELIERNIVYFE